MASVVLFCGSASAAVRSVDVAAPRDFGYVIGDSIPLDIRITLELPYKIDVEALPREGRVNRWLWLQNPRFTSHVQGDVTIYRLRFIYQILSAPETIQRITTPQHILFYVGDNQRRPIVLEAWAFTAGPLVTRSADGIKYTDIKPELPPPSVSLWGYWVGIVLSLVGLVGAVLILVYLRWGLPWLQRSRRPFARAYREIRGFSPSSPSQYEEALRLTHRAFDETAGVAVFNGTLAKFFIDNPEFEPQRAEIERFYSESQRRFFTNYASKSNPDLDALVNLCRVCRDAERGLI